MEGILSPGDTVHLEGGGSCRIERLIGSGGQGEVYRAKWDDLTVAVKWYYPDSGTPAQRENLQRLADSGSPNRRFLWPLALATIPGRPSFGYVMHLRKDRYANISDLLARRRRTTFRALTAAGVHLADAFYQLHGKGLCYRDISHNNVFIDPDSGEILICDNDNVGPVDMPSDIGGTMRYMAPEVVRGEALPSVNTDLYSLAVLLFTMLMNHHPLDGRREARIHCFNEAAMRRLYGTDPLFIWDPRDDDNKPDAEYQRNAVIFWRIYPKFLRDLFVEAFTTGMSDPSQRVTEGRWRRTLGRLHDALVYCPSCQRQNFSSPATPQAPDLAGTCWGEGCGARIPMPPRLRIKEHVVMLQHDSKLYRQHLDPLADYDYVDSVARVSQHPSDPSRWGLTNESSEHWTVITPSGEMLQLDPTQTIGLRDRTRIHFGKVEGEVRL